MATRRAPVTGTKDDTTGGSKDDATGGTNLTVSRAFLVIAALALANVSRNYGVNPEQTLRELFGFTITSKSEVHMFRAVMGLYLAFAGYWIAGAVRTAWTRPALVSVVLVMGGLAGGRVLSVFVDGTPDPTLTTYLIVEVVFAVGAGALLWWTRPVRPTS